MAKHDFSALFDQYPAVIAQMPATFTSHQFIQCLAQHHQVLYVEALAAYREVASGSTAAPFMFVHAFLSKHLTALPLSVTPAGRASSRDIFGQPSRCAQWQRVSA